MLHCAPGANHEFFPPALLRIPCCSSLTRHFKSFGSFSLPGPEARGRDEQKRNGRGLLRSEEHTSELQSHHDLVCRLLLEKKKIKKNVLVKNRKSQKYNEVSL